LLDQSETKATVAREQAPFKRREGGNDHPRRIIQALTSMLVTDAVKLLHCGRVVHYGRLVKVKDLPRASLWKLLKNKLEGSRQWQWELLAGTGIQV
jgi:hypothetical protein